MPDSSSQESPIDRSRAEALLSVHCLSKSFGETRPAVDGVSFQVGRGELVALLGESGCGKTTTLKMVNRLIELDEGEIFLDGRNVSEFDAVELRRHIGYLFQAVGLFPHMTVAENVAITPQLLGWSVEERVKRVRELLQIVKLPPDEYSQRYPTELSGGQRQRVGFARALAAKPQLLLLDEPFGALDPVTRDHLQVEFREIQKSLNLATLMVTHDMTEALLLADRILIMQEGRILQSGTPREVFNAPDGSFVERLMDTPRRQAYRLEELLGS